MMKRIRLEFIESDIRTLQGEHVLRGLFFAGYILLPGKACKVYLPAYRVTL